MERRLYFLDFCRGWAISFVVMFHGLVLHGMGGTNSAATDVPLVIQILFFPLIILGTWASVFASISGASISYAIFRQLRKGNTDFRKRLKASLNRGLILLTFHFIYTYFFIHPILNIFDESQTGMFVASIRQGELVIPSIKILFVSSALSMLAFTDLTITLVLFFICRNKGYLKVKRNIWILNLCGCFFIFTAPFFQLLLNPYITWSFDKQLYPLTLILVWLIGRYHCVFPYVGYAFFFAGFTMALVFDVDYNKLSKYMYSMSLTFLALSILSYPLGLWKDSGTQVLSFGFYILNLSLQIFLFTFLMIRFDFREDREKFNFKWMFVRRWGVLSLTSFLLEGIVANSILAFFKLFLAEEIVHHPVFIICIFGPFFMSLWILFLIQWERFDFKYSLEWLMALTSVKKMKVFMRTNLMKVNEVLYYPAGVKRVGRQIIALTPIEKIQFHPFFNDE